MTEAPKRIWAWEIDHELFPAGYYSLDEVDESAAYILATALAASPEGQALIAASRLVKPLVWEQLGARAWRAPSPLFGSFRVEKYGSSAWQALWSVPGFCDTFVEGDFDSPEGAMQAIEARILAALEPAPGALAALERIKAEARKEGRREGLKEVFGDMVTLNQAHFYSAAEKKDPRT
jgi:hypothetical protein